MVAGGVSRAAFAQSLEAANCRVTVANTEMECDTTPLNKHVRRIEEERGATRSVWCAVCGVLLCCVLLCYVVLCCVKPCCVKLYANTVVTLCFFLSSSPLLLLSSSPPLLL